jgi:hypothetical protein
MENESDALRITFRVYKDEDAAVFSDLSNFSGPSRIRRLRALIRAGLATLQGIPEAITAPHLVQGNVLNFPTSEKTPTPGALFEAFEALDFDPRDFSFEAEAGASA